MVTLGFGMVGFADDYLKINHRSSRGLNGRLKLAIEILVAAVAVLWIMRLTPDALAQGLAVPFLKQYVLQLGWFFVVLAVFVVVGASNAVNLTDGLDGLAILPTVLVGGALGVFAYLTGNFNFSSYLGIPYVPGVGEMVVVLV